MAAANLKRVVASMAGLVLTGFAPTAAAAEDVGRMVYEQTCVACHGADGKGVLPGVPDLTEADARVVVKYLVRAFGAR